MNGTQQIAPLKVRRSPIIPARFERRQQAGCSRRQLVMSARRPWPGSFFRLDLDDRRQLAELKELLSRACREQVHEAGDHAGPPPSGGWHRRQSLIQARSC